ncbi:protein FAM122A-like isoform X2 [Mus caroli]|uniref:Protein FAM122A-like isoform X2 n=1 Tax=Mus caroli TaxID=10089 RepID=A0A6P5P5M8_MUSCR|nr:protein FAM122A-like isoform X2 [Mus caroli]
MACCRRETTVASYHQDMSLNEEEPDTLQNFQLGRGFILNTDVIQETMEVDSGLVPTSSSVDISYIRRSNSNPLVNGFGDNSQGFQVGPTRMRRNSSPFLNQHGLLFLPSRSRTSANRIFQIKQEEGMDIASREAMHERDMHTALQISRSVEECLNLNDNNTVKSSAMRNINLNPFSPVASLPKRPRKGEELS